MGNQIEKRIEKLRQQPNDVSPSELDVILRYYGFKRHRMKGSHQVYYHPKIRDPLIIPYRRPIKFVYVKKAVRAIEYLEELECND